MMVQSAGEESHPSSTWVGKYGVAAVDISRPLSSSHFCLKSNLSADWVSLLTVHPRIQTLLMKVLNEEGEEKISL